MGGHIHVGRVQVVEHKMAPAAQARGGNAAQPQHARGHALETLFGALVEVQIQLDADGGLPVTRVRADEQIGMGTYRWA